LRLGQPGEHGPFEGIDNARSCSFVHVRHPLRGAGR
jgi:hypothetical protein